MCENHDLYLDRTSLYLNILGSLTAICDDSLDSNKNNTEIVRSLIGSGRIDPVRELEAALEDYKPSWFTTTTLDEIGGIIIAAYLAQVPIDRSLLEKSVYYLQMGHKSHRFVCFLAHKLSGVHIDTAKINEFTWYSI